jgi:tetratricopeptide (TPR) repeat protein
MKVSIHAKRLQHLSVSIVILGSVLSGCSKYLDEKPDKRLVTPSSAEDIRALLDHNYVMNTLAYGLGEASADNYYLTEDAWASLNDAMRNIYVWGDEIAFEFSPNPWQNLYVPVNYANVALEAIDRLTSGNLNNEFALLKGSALFYRSYSFFILTVTWAKQYHPNTSSQDLGVPLRLTSDFNVVSTRATVQQCYDRIIQDLNEALELLPVEPAHSMRPSKWAVYGLLSRVYLSMRDYDNALHYANLCLQIKSELLDYNLLNTKAPFPIPPFNEEVIFNTNGGSMIISPSIAIIDTALYASYEDMDLRKRIYFNILQDGSARFKGSYFGTVSHFMGLAVDEILLTRAECFARTDRITEALLDLNNLLIHRYEKDQYEPISVQNENEVLAIILRERRKELVMRDVRWMDLKRLNLEPAHARKIVRQIDGRRYELTPNENRYALPIPMTVIEISGMPQNPR